MTAALVIVALVAGAFGGVIASAFMEAYFGRRAAEEVGAYDPPDEPSRPPYYDEQGNWHPPSASPFRRSGR